jgi:NAD(P)-dependent dehydrogenase (short-subunit alcohol dehydrogenase family)
MDGLRGRVAVISGAASGIGLALAERLAVLGARPLLLDVNEDRLAEATARVPGSLAMRCDVGDQEAVRAAADWCAELLGPTAIVCANAGISGPTGQRLWEVPKPDWDHTFRTNLDGALNMLRAFMPQVLQAEHGYVLITASMAALTSSATVPAYYASKHAVLSVAETLRRQVARDRMSVSVSVLLPSAVATNLAESHDGEFDRWADFPEKSAALDPREVAVAAVDALASGRFYVFTHPDSRPRIEAAYTELLAAY